MSSCVTRLSDEQNKAIAAELGERCFAMMTYLRKKNICASCSLLLIQTSLLEGFRLVAEMEPDDAIHLTMMAMKTTYADEATIIVTEEEHAEPPAEVKAVLDDVASLLDRVTKKDEGGN